MTDWQSNSTQGYCWLEASAYTLVVTEPTGQTYLPSYSAIYAATFPSLVGLACNSPEMIAAMGALEGQPWQAGQMHGYAYSYTGYPANLQIGLAAAADSAVSNAHQAWSLFESRSVKPSGTTAYNNYPNFAVIPRSVETGTSTAPPTMPPPDTAPQPVTPPPPSTQPPTLPPSPTAAPPKTKPSLPPSPSVDARSRPVGPVFGPFGRGATIAPGAALQHAVPAMVKVVLPPCRNEDSAGGPPAVHSGCRVKPTGMAYRTAMK